MRTAKDNALEFGALTKQGKDVRLALLVACSVERPAMGRPGNSDNRPTFKVTPVQFAEVAQTSDKRIKRHLDAWDKLAEHGLVTAAAELVPNDVETLAISDEAIEAFETGGVFDASNAGGRPRASSEEIAESFGSRPEFRRKVMRGMTPKQRQEFVEETLEAEPDLAGQILAGEGTAADALEDAVESTQKKRHQRIRDRQASGYAGMPLSAYFWRMVGKLGEWARDLITIRDELTTLSESEQAKVRDKHYELLRAVQANIDIIEGVTADDDVIEGRETVTHELTA